MHGATLSEPPAFSSALVARALRFSFQWRHATNAKRLVCSQQARASPDSGNDRQRHGFGVARHQVGEPMQIRS